MKISQPIKRKQPTNQNKTSQTNKAKSAKNQRKSASQSNESNQSKPEAEGAAEGRQEGVRIFGFGFRQCSAKEGFAVPEALLIVNPFRIALLLWGQNAYRRN